MDLYHVKRRSLFTWSTTRNGIPLDLSMYLGKPYARRAVAESYAQSLTRADKLDAEYGVNTGRPPYQERSESPVKVAAREVLGVLTLATLIAMSCYVEAVVVKELW